MSQDLYHLFNSGLLLLHNFQYNEANEAFLNIQKGYSEFIPAYWGEAMTYNHPTWDEEDLPSACNALNKLASTPEQRLNLTTNPLEKGLINAANRLYGNGTKDERNLVYLAAMLELAQQFPNDDDIVALTALAILGAHRGNRDVPDYVKAAKMLEPVLQRNPNHQGALHYFIHCYDDREHAHLALDAARRYESLGPLSAHARHMPSHIYLALGLWQDVVRANRYSLLAESNTTDYDIHYLHSLQWVHYGYLRLRQFEAARQVFEDMYNLVLLHKKDPMYIWYYDLIRATHIVTTNDTNMPKAVNHDQLELSAIASTVYADAIINLYQYNQDIRPNITQLQTLYKQRQQDYSQFQPNDNYFTSINENGLNVAKVVIDQLNAHYLRSIGRRTEAIELLNRIIAFENTLPEDYGPPNPPKLTKELLVEFLSK